MPLASKTLTLTWASDGAAYSVRFVGANSTFRQCFVGIQPGPTYSCSVDVPPGAKIEIEAFPPTLTGTVTAWGGACAGIGTGIGQSFPNRAKCVLTMDGDLSVSATFSS
jgi:hypothetical protein